MHARIQSPRVWKNNIRFESLETGRTCVCEKHSSKETYRLEDKLSERQIRGWRALSAERSPGKGSNKRIVFSQTPVGLPYHHVEIAPPGCALSAARLQAKGSPNLRLESSESGRRCSRGGPRGRGWPRPRIGSCRVALAGVCEINTHLDVAGVFKVPTPLP